jgi:hypothetical protein
MWMSTINPATGSGYRSAEEFERVGRMSPEEIAAEYTRLRASPPAPPGPVQLPSDREHPPAIEPVVPPPLYTPANQNYTPARAPSAVEGPVSLPGMPAAPFALAAPRILRPPAAESLLIRDVAEEIRGWANRHDDDGGPYRPWLNQSYRLRSLNHILQVANTRTTCARCAANLDRNLRGLPYALVFAGRLMNEADLVERYFPGQTQGFVRSNYWDISREIVNAGPNATGIVSHSYVVWDPAKEALRWTGHFYNVVNIRGMLIYLDAQSRAVRTPVQVQEVYRPHWFLRTQ